MTFVPLFPPTLSLGATGGTGWRTVVTETAVGEEYRIGTWATSLGRWIVGKNLQKGAERDALMAFHRVSAGQHGLFRFRDWTDFQVLSGEGVLTQVGADTVLAKAYTVVDVFGSPQVALRYIQRPVSGTIVFSDGSTVSDYEAGIVAGGTIGVTTWVGEFDVAVRFLEDRPDIAVQPTADAAGWRGITLQEVR